MSSLDRSRKAGGKIKTAKEWVPLGAALTRAVQVWSQRDDVTVTVNGSTVEDGAVAPAYLDIAKAEIVVNAGTVGLDNPDKLIGSQHALLGMALHEASHARWSHWLDADALKGLSPKVIDTMRLLEESRIEAKACAEIKFAPELLRASAQKLILEGIAEGSDKLNETQVAARTLALTEARVTAGSLEAQDVTDVYRQCHDVLGADVVKRLRELWTEAQRTDDHDPTYLSRLATAWVEALGDDPEDDSEPDSGEDEGDGGGAGSALAEALSQAMSGSGTEERAQTALDQGPAPVDQDGEPNDGMSNSDDADESDGDNGWGPQGGYSQGSPVRFVSRTQPRASDVRACRKIADALRKVMRPDRVAVKRLQDEPGGRLVVRKAIERQQQVSMGLVPDARPWRHTARKTVPHPPVAIGILGDTSGSMREYMPLLASLSWAIPKAAETFGATSALVYFGDSVQVGLKAGQRPTEVCETAGAGGSALFGNAWKALQGEVRILGRHAKGHRVLVIVSDMEILGLTEVEQVLKGCKRDGVHVLMVGPYVSDAEHYRREFGVKVIEGSDMSAVVDAISEAVR